MNSCSKGPDRLKVLVAVDMEGIAGLVQWDGNQLALQGRLMTEEANAAARGAFAAGATEVLVVEAHASMRLLVPELLDSRVRFLSGQPKPLNHVAGVDQSVDLALLVGYHARAGALRALMCHTYRLDITSVKFNGIEMGEVGTNAALCGHYGVPVGLVSGDQAAANEARSLLGDVRCVVVKEAVSRSAAVCLPLEKARQMIEAEAAEAVTQAGQFRPFVIEGPVTVEVTWIDPSYADGVEHLDFVTRLDGLTVRTEADDFVKAFHRFMALGFLAPAVR